MKQLFYILTVCLLFTSCNLSLSNFTMTGPSMLPALKDGEHVKVRKSIDSLTYGDIIIFAYTGSGIFKSYNGYFLSRVVALPGDSIATDKDMCIINGKKIDYQFIQNIDEDRDEYEELFPNNFKLFIYSSLRHPEKADPGSETIQVPLNHYYVMGDNRTGSFDSRTIGCIPKEQIYGKVIEINKKTIVQDVQSDTN